MHVLEHSSILIVQCLWEDIWLYYVILSRLWTKIPVYSVVGYLKKAFLSHSETDKGIASRPAIMLLLKWKASLRQPYYLIQTPHL